MADITVPQVDFSILGNLGKTYQDAQKQALRERTLAELGQGGGPLDYNQAARKLLSVGDREGAMSLAQLGNNQRDFQFRQQESQRSQGNADRSYRLQERAATEKPQYQVIEGSDGQKQIIKLDPYGKGASVVTPTGLNQEPANPFMTGGKMNEAQSKDALYTSRMLNAEKVLREPAVETSAMSAWERGKAMLPGAGNMYNPNSVEFQKFDQAKRDFINSTLRRESGAVISDAEFANAEKQYFPAPGDSKEVLGQKRQNRMTAIKGIGAGAGAGYRPEASFDQAGNIVPRAAPQSSPQAGGITKEQYDALPPGTPYTAPDGSQRVKK